MFSRFHSPKDIRVSYACSSSRHRTASSARAGDRERRAWFRRQYDELPLGRRELLRPPGPCPRLEKGLRSRWTVRWSQDQGADLTLQMGLELEVVPEHVGEVKEGFGCAQNPMPRQHGNTSPRSGRRGLGARPEAGSAYPQPKWTEERTLKDTG